MSPARATVERAGIDTWSPCWYVDHDSPSARAMLALARVPGPLSSWLVPGDVAGHRVGWFPATHLVFAEGHPAEAGQLARVTSLPGALDRLVRALDAAGLPLPPGRALRAPRRGREPRPGFAGLRRLDAAVDVRFEDPALGLAVLGLVGWLDPPRGRTSVWTDRGRVTTVYLHGYARNSVRGRIYDKGNDSGDAPRGQLIRLEDQRRWQAGRRPAVDVGPATVHRLFRDRFGYTARAPRAIVGKLPALGERLAQLVDEGAITPGRAERMLGFIGLEAVGHARQGMSRRTYYRRRAEVRELGLVLAQVPGQAHDLDLAALLEPALGPGAWERIEQDAAAAAAG